MALPLPNQEVKKSTVGTTHAEHYENCFPLELPTKHPSHDTGFLTYLEFFREKIFFPLLVSNPKAANRLPLLTLFSMAVKSL